MTAGRDGTDTADGRGDFPFAVSFTGHRPGKGIYGYDEHGAWQQLCSCVADALRDIAARHGGRLRVVTGGAQGVDQIAFWAAEHARDASTIQNAVFVPFPGQDGRWGEDGDFGRRAYRRMLSMADEVVFCSEAPPAAGQAGRLLQARNVRMLEESDLLVAVTSMGLGDLPARGSGTANAIRTAMGRRMPILRIDPYDGDGAPSWLLAPDAAGDGRGDGSDDSPQGTLF